MVLLRIERNLLWGHIFVPLLLLALALASEAPLGLGSDSQCDLLTTSPVQASSLLQTAGGPSSHYQDFGTRDLHEDDYMLPAAERSAVVSGHASSKTLSAIATSGGNNNDNDNKEVPQNYLIKQATSGHAAQVPEYEGADGCLTEAGFGATASEGSPCVFGVDDRDEGSHCIQDHSEKYGEFGWCYTQGDASLWGACNSACPMWGPHAVLDKKLMSVEEKLMTLMEEVDAMPAKCTGYCSKSKPAEISKEGPKHGGKSAPTHLKPGMEPKEAKHGGKSAPSSMAPSTSGKQAKHGGKSEPNSESLLRQHRHRRI